MCLRNFRMSIRTALAVVALGVGFASPAFSSPPVAEVDVKPQDETETANRLLERARKKIESANSAIDTERKVKLRTEARRLVGRTRKAFTKIHDDRKSEFAAFPVYIDPADKEQFAARRSAEVAYMAARIRLAECLVDESRTHDSGTAESKEPLEKAAMEFGEIHRAYRTQVAGLHARLWQGRCYAMLGEARKAEGIYREILTLPGEHETLKALRAAARSGLDDLGAR